MSYQNGETSLERADGSISYEGGTQEALYALVATGDLSKLSTQDRNAYYGEVCRSVGLNPLTRPFDYIRLNGKVQLYAKKDATDQLRKLHGVSITRLEYALEDGIYTVTAYARDAHGREDVDQGSVPIGGAKGEALANAKMKAVTKAKRRVTLSICGLGFLDETELETIPSQAIGESPSVETEMPTEEETDFDATRDHLYRQLRRRLEEEVPPQFEETLKGARAYVKEWPEAEQLAGRLRIEEVAALYEHRLSRLVRVRAKAKASYELPEEEQGVLLGERLGKLGNVGQAWKTYAEEIWQEEVEKWTALREEDFTVGHPFADEPPVTGGSAKEAAA